MIKDQIIVRRNQIEREISKVEEQIKRKSQRDFKTPEAFSAWQQRQQCKLEDLYSELAILDYPEGYYEIPLAVAASELGISLTEVVGIVREGLIELSYRGVYSVGSRLTRNELARAIDVGAPALIAMTRESPREIFRSARPDIIAGNIEVLRTAYDRIDRRDSCINPFALALEVGIQFLSQDPQAVGESLEFISRRQEMELEETLLALKELFELIPTQNHLMEAIRERVLLTANGSKDVPFRDTFSPYLGSRLRRSKMDAVQQRALFLSDVIMTAIEKYKFVKSIERFRPFKAESRAEIQRLISNAVYTARRRGFLQ